MARHQTPSTNQLRGLRRRPLWLDLAHHAGSPRISHNEATNLESLACQGVAPTLVPVKAGDRVKMDRRDALTLDELSALSPSGLVQFRRKKNTAGVNATLEKVASY